MTVESLAYEYQCVQEYRDQHGAHAWHWLQASTDLLIACGWMKPEDIAEHRRIRLRDGTYQEFGLDGIGLRVDGGYDALQAKRWLQGVLNHEELGSYLSAVMAMQDADAVNGAVLYHAPGSRISPKIIGILDCPQRNRRVYELAPADMVKPITDVDETALVLRPIQTEALDVMAANPRVIQALACASGKTLINAVHARNFDIVVIASPLIASADQNLHRTAAFLPEHKPLAFWSGKVLDTEVLKERLAQPKALVSTTYKSADMVFDVLRNVDPAKKVFIIMDEAHNLGDELDGRAAQQLAFQGPSHWNVVLATATPSSALKDMCTDREVDAFVDFSYPLWRAIADGSCTDYTISIPLVVDNATRLPVELRQLDAGEGEWDAMGRAVFLGGTMLHDGARRCIAYFESKAQCAAFAAAFAHVCKDYLGVDGWTGQITEDTRGRDAILREFQAQDDHVVLRVITSVRILDEAINVPKCNSVFLASVSNTINERSAARIVQRISRAIRLDADNPQKVARAYLWTRDCEDDAMSELLWTLREADPGVMSKVRCDSMDYDRARGNAAVAKLCHKELEAWTAKWSVRAVSTRDRIEMKVQALCKVCKTAPPTRAPVTLDDGTQVDLVTFLMTIKPNWHPCGLLGGKTTSPSARLTTTQKMSIEHGCAWLAERKDGWLKKWAQESGRYTPTVLDKVDALCTQCRDAPPKHGVVSTIKAKSGQIYECDLSGFVRNIARNWHPLSIPHTKLSQEIMASIERDCSWVLERVEGWRVKWRQQDYRPTVSDKIDALCTLFPDSPPKRGTITTVDGKFKFDAGVFLRDIAPNWNPAAESKRTQLAQQAMVRVERGCSWFPTRLASWQARWAACV